MESEEYKTASEFAENFDSDSEIPEDKLLEKKMLFKSKKLRVYKRILKLGSSQRFSAKYD